ncbi:cytochrome C, partial [Vibrio parahaemolyticus]|nr:cytochrome C [Vibrio parahaemolyticus]MDL2045226.1 cytochrome C [Vibrio parahaemolyticus]
MNGLKSIATLIFFILLLTGCGPDSKNDQNTPPPALGDFEISVSEPSLVTQETGETKLVVDFTVKDGSGRSHELDETKDFRIALLKAMPSRVDTQNSSDPAFAFNGRHGNTYWKSFHHSSNTTNNRASMESVWDGTLVKTDEGYRYTFAIPDVLKVSDPYTADSS